MKKLKVGIIGTGGISASHMNGYKALGDRVEVVAACDIDGEKLSRYSEKHGIPRTYTDYNEMMEREQLDCVSVTTWNAAHKGAVIAALRGGANVLCEKPMAINAAEAEEMRTVARECGKLLQIGFVRRFGRDAETVRNLTKAGVMGDIYYGRAMYLRRDGCPGGWYGDKIYSGGGPLIDLGVHVIDLTRYLAGNPKPVSAFGVTFGNLGCNRASGSEIAWERSADKRQFTFSVEDFASAMIRFDNGFTLHVEASFNLNIPHDMGSVELFGTKAGAKITDKVELYSDMAGIFVNIAPQGATGFEFGRAFVDEIAGFVSAVEGKSACRATADDGVELMKILDAIYESARTGKSVDIH